MDERNEAKVGGKLWDVEARPWKRLKHGRRGSRQQKGSSVMLCSMRV